MPITDWPKGCPPEQALRLFVAAIRDHVPFVEHMHLERAGDSWMLTLHCSLAYEYSQAFSLHEVEQPRWVEQMIAMLAHQVTQAVGALQAQAWLKTKGRNVYTAILEVPHGTVVTSFASENHRIPERWQVSWGFPMLPEMADTDPLPTASYRILDYRLSRVDELMRVAWYRVEHIT